ncbi:MAG TPA: hypothetical protein VNV66_05830 [Pilimelia sp.]|nr:hypothetical protein [Pilimelia sp.]
MSRIVRTLVVALTGLAIFAPAVPAGAAEFHAAEFHRERPTTVFVTGDAPGEAEKPAPERSVQVAVPAWRYYITASCASRAAEIRRGAAYWGNGVETTGSGTPVGCTSGYVTGCGAARAVGCNWGRGQRIMLSTMVRDFALLAAHEFGHNWYGHSGTGCASWTNANTVMRTNMC